MNTQRQLVELLSISSRNFSLGNSNAPAPAGLERPLTSRYSHMIRVMLRVTGLLLLLAGGSVYGTCRDSERLWSANRSKQADCGIVCISRLKPSGVGDICKNPLGSKDDYYTDRPLHTPSCSFRALVTPVSRPPGFKKNTGGKGGHSFGHMQTHTRHCSDRCEDRSTYRLLLPKPAAFWTSSTSAVAFKVAGLENDWKCCFYSYAAEVLLVLTLPASKFTSSPLSLSSQTRSRGSNGVNVLCTCSRWEMRCPFPACVYGAFKVNR